METCVCMAEFLCCLPETITMLLIGIPNSSEVKNPPAVLEPQEIQVRSLGWEDPLELQYSWRILETQRIPWTEEPSGLQPVESQSRT